MTNSLEQIQDLVEFKPYPAGNCTHDVAFHGGVIPHFAKKFAYQANLKLASMHLPEIPEEDLKAYLDTLLYNRVLLAREEKPVTSKNTLKRVLIPSIYQLALSQIGVAEDKDTLDVFVPAMDKPERLMSDGELEEFSVRLGYLQDYGFELNRGFPLELEGNLHFMTWSLIEGNYYREDKQAPSSLGILHAFFEVQQLDSIIRPRICYGMKSYFDELLGQLIYDSFRRSR